VDLTLSSKAGSRALSSEAPRFRIGWRVSVDKQYTGLYYYFVSPIFSMPQYWLWISSADGGEQIAGASRGPTRNLVQALAQTRGTITESGLSLGGSSMRDPRTLSLLVVAFAATGLLAGTPAVLTAAECPADLESTRAQIWLQRAGEVPQALEELERIPADLRGAVFALLPPEVKSELWAGALRTYLADHPRLTPDQAQLIRDTIDLVTPAYFSLHPGDLGWRQLVDQPAQAVAKRGQTLFSSSEFQTVFIDMTGVLARTAEPATEVPATVWCTCSTSVASCGGLGSFCQTSVCTGHLGCGLTRNYWCDGTCINGN
jgi:hypothetical protein